MRLTRGYVSGARRVLGVVERRRAMRFPPFDPEIHASLVGRSDYARFAALGLAVRRLDEEGVAGALAEVGVHRGEVSELLHRMAPQRRLYLFDTFEGFPVEQLEPSQAGDKRFKDTSLEAVRARLGDSANVVFRKGIVPATLEGLEDERFAFVLLDLDLLQPTVTALEFFYPRLTGGGFLLVHDYNNPESDWAGRRALDTFMADKTEGIVELPDLWGTALIRRAKA